MVKKAAQATPNMSLRLARLEHGWTQKDVAERIGAPLDLNVTRWERGTAKPSAFYVQKLCELFGKSASELGLLPPQQQEISPIIPQAGISTNSEQPERLWSVPFQRNPFFTGRAELLERLYQQMKKERCAALTQSHAQSHALVGLGGIGKTQVALEYAYRYRDEYLAVFWVRAANHETLVTDYVELARMLTLPGQELQEQMRVVAATKRWFAHHDGWLLVLDNADDLSLLNDFLPTGGNGHLLLTTQAQATGKIAISFPVDTLDHTDSILLLLRRARLLAIDAPLDEVSAPIKEQAQAIVEELDGLPLALDQAGAYIEETDCSLADYLQLYHRRRLALLSRQSNLAVDYPRTVANTWSLSFGRVEQASRAAAELLRLCAFLHADAIPETFIIEGAEHLPVPLQEVVSDSLLFNEAIQLLRRYSLIKRDAEARLLNIHRLVQVVLKESMDEETRRQWAERTIRLVNAAFPDVSFDVWSRCELCMPHVQMCVDLIDNYSLHSPEAARLLHQAGRYLHERGQYTRAEALLQRAISIAEELLGTSHPDVATVLTDLAESYWSQERYAQAEILYQRAMHIYEQAPDSSHTRIATTLNDLGLLYAYQEQYEQAEAHLQRSLAIREQELEDIHADIGESFNNLAWVYYRQGKYEQAEQLYQRGLSIREQALGSEHPTTAQSLDNLALLYSDLGKYEQAEPLLQRALTIFEHSVGPKHQDTAIALRTQADLYYKQEQYERARPLYQKALTIFEQALGSDHPYVALCLQNLARIDVHEGKYEQALTLYQRALHIREQVQGSEYPATVKARKEYEEVLHRLT